MTIEKADSDANIYLKVNPSDFMNRINIGSGRTEYLPDDFLTNNEIREHLLDTRYGPVFVCLGAFLTPLFLVGSNANKRCLEFRYKMSFIRTNMGQNVVDYSEVPQVVSNDILNDCVGHTVLETTYKFREGERGARAYWIYEPGCIKARY